MNRARVVTQAFLLLVVAHSPCQAGNDTSEDKILALLEEEGTLHAAVEAGDLEQAERLLAAGAAINQKNRSGQTPLILAIAWKRPEVVSLLLNAGADVNLPSDTGDLPLIYSIERHQEDIALHLLKAGANPNAANRAGKLPLHESIRRRLPALTNEIIRGGADISKEDASGSRPLHLAARLLEESVQPLLEAGADVDARDRQGSTPLNVAALHGTSTTLRKLIAAGGGPCARDKHTTVAQSTFIRAAFAGKQENFLLIGEIIEQRYQASPTVRMAECRADYLDLQRKLVMIRR